MHPMPPILPCSRTPNPEHDTEFWNKKAQNFLREQLKPQNMNLAKNIILVMGDGLSIPTIAAARVYNNVGKNGDQLSFESFPHTGLAKVNPFRLKRRKIHSDPASFRPTAWTNKRRIVHAQQPPF